MKSKMNVLVLACFALCVLGATGCEEPMSATVKAQTQAAVDMKKIDADRQTAKEKNDMELEKARIAANLELSKLASQERLAALAKTQGTTAVPQTPTPVATKVEASTVTVAGDQGNLTNTATK